MFKQWNCGTEAKNTDKKDGKTEEMQMLGEVNARY